MAELRLVEEELKKGIIELRKIDEPESRPVFSFVKRTFDIVSSMLATIILLIPMLIIAAAIKIESAGPVFYRQERLGLNGKPIVIWKFRSMHIDAEADGAQWAQEHDIRCTKVGAFLRRYHLDELPQLPFNVLTGDMSIVGPRPEREVFYELFARYIDGFEQRMYVKPGLTGLAQINGGYRLRPEEKIVYDLEYIETRSVLVDLDLIFKTVGVIFSNDGAR